MNAGPPRAVEALVAVLLPPACRESVLGDLHERYQSAGQYVADALGVIPLVVLSRIRRTTELEVLLLEALAMYVAFLA